uniref:Proteasome 26S subunit ubiquitin receptor, non-ATPase 4 n=1 Tax=Hucho hucho TaxID=62062 RepID=A0A4W5P6A6_9TELE
MFFSPTHLCPSLISSVDNSEYMRNGDFLPTRLQAQQDAVNIVCRSKTPREQCRPNLDGKVSLCFLCVQNMSKICFCTGIRVAHLAVKHRQGKNHKMRIIAFVGSPVEDRDKDLVKMAKCLKKEKVNVDIIHFGEEEFNTEKLTAFINTLNGKEGTGSHLVTVPPGPSLTDALLCSPILAGEGGSMMGLGASDFEFGVDPSADPELALALCVSMEEQRQRQEDEARRVAVASAADVTTTTADGKEREDALLKMPVSQPETGGAAVLPDFSNMTEEDQIAYAMRMSLAEAMPLLMMCLVVLPQEEDDYDVMQDPDQTRTQTDQTIRPNRIATRIVISEYNQKIEYPSFPVSDLPHFK